MRKTALCLAFVLLLSCAPAAFAEGGDGIRWFENGLPNGLADMLLAHPGGYSPVYFPEQDWFSAASDSGSADYFPLVDLATGGDLGYYDVCPLGGVLRYSDRDGTRHGLLGTDGAPITEANFDYLYYDDTYACIVGERGGEDVYFAPDGTKLPDKPHRARGLYPAFDADLSGYGYVDETGATVIPGLYAYAREFYNGYGLVEDLSGKMALIDSDGTLVTDFLYDFIDYRELDPSDPGGSPIRVRADDRWGFIDHDGNSLTDLKYDEVEPFSDGLAAVLIGNKWGYIDASGGAVIEPDLDVSFAGPFTGGLAVLEDRTSALIDRDGKLLTAFDRYAYIEAVCGLAIAENGDGMTLIDAEGREVFSRPYRYMTFINYELSDYGRYVLISDGERFGIYENPDFRLPPAQEDPAAPEKERSPLLWILPVCAVLAALLVAAALIFGKKRVLAAPAAAPAKRTGGAVMNFCPKCGARLSRGDRFCPKCGHRL